MHQPVDFYKILQVDPEAHPDVIRAAYRVLARAYHPDIQGGSAEMMVALNNAWAVISDERKRAEYDQGRAAAIVRDAPDDAAPRETVHVGHAPDRPITRRRGAAPAAVRSTVLDFGRYQGWPLDEVARQDPDFLEWLSRTPIGRPYRAEIDVLLAASRVVSKPPAKGRDGGRRGSAWSARR
jgi:curved DNA-binding protein CbpA